VLPVDEAGGQIGVDQLFLQEKVDRHGRIWRVEGYWSKSPGARIVAFSEGQVPGPFGEFGSMGFWFSGFTAERSNAVCASSSLQLGRFLTS
jgi:hypothetical protein